MMKLIFHIRFFHILLTDTQVPKIGNGSSADVIFSKTQLPKMIMSESIIFGSSIF